MDEGGGGGGTTPRTGSIAEWALNHPLCQTNVTAYVGQTAKMHCCLARLDRDLSVILKTNNFPSNLML